MFFTKIGITATGTVEITYEEEHNNWKRVRLQSDDPPLPSFNDALQALENDMANICDEDGFDREMLTIRSISIKDHDRLGQGVSITAVKVLTNGLNLALTSPMLYEYGKAVSLPKATRVKIATLEKEATKYVQGERLQGKLTL